MKKILFMFRLFLLLILFSWSRQVCAQCPAIAGPDQAQCNNGTFTMAANNPSSGGTWSVGSGTVTITNSTSATSTVTGLAPGSSAVLIWTVSDEGNVCTDSVVITNTPLPTVSNAGPDISQCNNGNFTMAANNPTTGTGTWTVILGTVNITTPGSFNTTVTGLAPGSSATLRWTISNGTCTSSFDNVVITNNALPTTSNAGLDFSQCNNGTFTMAANNPAVGTGVWTIISGTVTITNPNLFNTTVTGLAPGSSATLRWTISNGTCTSSVDNVVITNNALPTTSNAGLDITQCANGTFTMAANNPSVGTGLWTVISGTVNITNSGLFNTTVTGLAPGSSATLQWTISSGTCTSSSDNIVITNNANPATSNAGPDISQCNNGTFTMAANNPSVGTGLWTVISGTVNITNPGLFNSTITGLAAGSSATLQWSVTNGSCTSIDNIVITNNALPTVSNAGPDISQCNNGTFTMAANLPAAGSGLWSVISGTVTINSPALFNTTVTGLAAGASAILQWTISNGSCTSSIDNVVITNHALPATSSAGQDISQCNDATFAMAANNPAVGTGIWTIISGTVNIINPGSFNTTVTGLAPGSSATLQWTISNGTCTSSIDNVIITNNALPTSSNAGPDVPQCNNGAFTMAANNPTTGTGLWSVISGTVNITNPGLFNTTVTGLAAGTSANLQWTITNGTCTSTDNVVITNHALPTTSNAGSDQSQCSNSTFTLAANNPTSGTGIWSLVSGTANISSTGLFNTTVTGIPAGTSATLQWTITNSTCAPSFDLVVLTNDITSNPANAGQDLSNCNNGTFNLNANDPAPGTGCWSVISPPISITIPCSSITTVTGLAAGSSAILLWTITNGTCTSRDTIIITNYALPTTSSAGSDISQCDNGTFNMAGNNPSIGTGIWTVISGGVTITDSSLFNTSVTGLATGSSAILQWTISNGNCTTSTDQITITNNPRPAITTGTVADVSTSSNTFSIPFTATTNSPDQYSITVGSPPLANFTPVSNQNLGTSPIVVTIPASAAGSYNFSLTVRNSVTGCVSAPQSVALEVVPAIIAVTASLNQFTTCEGAASDAQSFTVSGSSLTGNLTISAPLGYEISTDPVNGYSQSLTLNQSSGIVTSTTIFVRLTSTANNGASGNITFTSSSVTQNLSTGSAIVHPNPATPVFSEAFDPNQVPGTSAVCGGSSLMALLVDNPESDFTYTWTAEPSNVIIADPVNPQTAVTFPDSANGYTAIVSLQAVSPGSQGSCKSQIQQLTVNVGSSQGINEKKIVPKQPGHLLVYLDNSSDLRYRWGVDSIIYDGSRQILTNPRLISGQVFQFFAPESRFVSPANGTFPEQLDTVNYAYWVQVIKVSPTDSVICYTRVYYNGPYCSLCRGKSNGEMISSDIQAMLWPNPVRNYFDLKLSGSIYGRMDVCILNSLGQTVDQRTFIKEDAEQRFRYELKDMPSGIYQLFIRGNRGEMVNVKFINVAP